MRDGSTTSNVKGMTSKDGIDAMMTSRQHHTCRPKPERSRSGRVRYRALDAAAGRDEFDQLVDAGGDVLLRRIDDEVGRLRLFVRAVDAGEVLELAVARPAVETLGIARLAGREVGLDVDLEEVPLGRPRRAPGAGRRDTVR